MTYGQPDRNANQQQGGAGYPQHLWPDYSQDPTDPAWQPRPIPAQRKSTALLGVLAFVLGLAALVAPFLPIDMTGFRQYAAFPFALPGVGLAIAGLIGPRRGKPLAVVGAVLCGLALGVGAIMLVSYL
ncbi:hypothetical protein [Kribbella jiaozuonensis]|uniref:DUF4190 domain-containing protein n=1 Tax=Kribbella jiaozuonensis TaxID=2575441 RepID=A0A4U3LUZ8_9ACTN|nr:hypothetical protein [Kribbella jiaozuonensis]TKK79958.1 hypothetical protein FDA38_16520 [Kribbella jiaozuonensis]